MSLPEVTKMEPRGDLLRFDPVLAELCLDHVDGDKFGGAYNRMGLSEEDDKERLKIMEAWGRYCMEGKWPDEE